MDSRSFLSLQAQAQHGLPPSGVKSSLFDVFVELYAGRTDIAINLFEEASKSGINKNEIVAHLDQLRGGVAVDLQVKDVQDAMAARNSMALPTLFFAHDDSGRALSEFAASDAIASVAETDVEGEVDLTFTDPKYHYKYTGDEKFLTVPDRNICRVGNIIWICKPQSGKLQPCKSCTNDWFLGKGQYCSVHKGKFLAPENWCQDLKQQAET